MKFGELYEKMDLGNLPALEEYYAQCAIHRACMDKLREGDLSLLADVRAYERKLEQFSLVTGNWSEFDSLAHSISSSDERYAAEVNLHSLYTDIFYQCAEDLRIPVIVHWGAVFFAHDYHLFSTIPIWRPRTSRLVDWARMSDTPLLGMHTSELDARDQVYIDDALATGVLKPKSSPFSL